MTALRLKLSVAVLAAALALPALAGSLPVPAGPGVPQIGLAYLVGPNLFVQGANFGVASPPVVQLGSTSLPVTSYSATQIVATVDASYAPGSYPLWVQTSTSLFGVPVTLFASLDVTLGAVGPQGPPGPPGAPGSGVTATWSSLPKVGASQPIPVQSNTNAGRTRIVAVTIPQDGNYLLLGTLRYYVPANWASIVCDVRDSRNYYNEGIVNAAPVAAYIGSVYGTLTLHAAYWFPAGMVVEVACQVWTQTPITAQFDQLLLSAILVNNLTAGTPAQ